MAESSGRVGAIVRALLTLVACAAILAGAGWVIWLIRTTEPKAERGGATRKGAALVETVRVSRGSYRPEIVVLGTVEPARETVLAPRVGGEVIALAESFVPGGFVDAGDVLLTVDPADFAIAVALRQADLRQAEAALAIEQGRRNVAEREFALLGEEIDPANRDLVLRVPQIASARAQVTADSVALERARLDLARTEVRAPFDAHILSRSVNLGSQVSAGDELALLVGIEEYWVVATVPRKDLARIDLRDRDGPGSAVRVRDRGAWREGVYRTGQARRLLGVLDAQTRLARLLITIRDPLARAVEGPPLILGTVVETRIEGRELADVTRLDRGHLREGDAVWVMVDGKLEIRPVEIVFEDARFAYVGSGLRDGDEVVVTDLATVAPGILLKRIESEAGPEEGR